MNGPKDEDGWGEGRDRKEEDALALRPFNHTHLHVPPRGERLLDLGVVVGGVEVGRDERHLHAPEHALELLPHVFGRGHGPRVDEVFPAPVLVW